METMQFVDTHCHIDLYSNYTAVIEATEQAQVYTVAVTNTPSVFRQCAELLRGKRFLRPAIGLHPELVMQRHHELTLFSQLIYETKYVGEVGLDFVTTDSEVRALQRRVFASVLDQCAQRGRKVLTIHSRRAATEVVDMIGYNFPGICILHWFSGSALALRRAIAQGYYFSINPSMIMSAKGCQLIDLIPPSQILTETDGPFVKLKGRSAYPSDVRNVVGQLSNIWNVSEEEAAAIIYNNFRRIVVSS